MFFKQIIIKKGVEIVQKCWIDWLKKVQYKNFVQEENVETIRFQKLWTQNFRKA